MTETQRDKQILETLADAEMALFQAHALSDALDRIDQVRELRRAARTSELTRLVAQALRGVTECLLELHK